MRDISSCTKTDTIGFVKGDGSVKAYGSGVLPRDRKTNAGTPCRWRKKLENIQQNSEKQGVNQTALVIDLIALMNGFVTNVEDITEYFWYSQGKPLDNGTVCCSWQGFWWIGIKKQRVDKYETEHEAGGET